jgi:hypothetical protein
MDLKIDYKSWIKKLKFSKVIFGLFTFAIIGFLVLIFLSKKENSSLKSEIISLRKQIQEPDHGTPSKNVSIKNGVYTDYDKGFTFNYPKDFFNLTEEGYMRNNKISVLDDKDKGDKPEIELYVISNDFWKNEFSQTMIDLEVGQKLKSYGITKLQNLSVDGMKGAVWFQDNNTIVGQAPPHYVYNATWIRNEEKYKGEYTLNMKIFDDNNYEQYKPMFDKMVSSFKLLK